MTPRLADKLIGKPVVLVDRYGCGQGLVGSIVSRDRWHVLFVYTANSLRCEAYIDRTDIAEVHPL
jgi:hypothetical protein